MGGYLFLNGRAGGEDQGHILIQAEEPWPVWGSGASWTIEFWYNAFEILAPDSDQGGRCVLFTFRPKNDLKASPAIQMWIFAGGYPQLRLLGSVVYPALRVEKGEPFLQSLKAQNDCRGAWTHVAIQQDGQAGKIRMLLNGGADSGGETIEQDLDPHVRFGRLDHLQINGLNEAWYKAKLAIDEFRVWNDAVPADRLGFRTNVGDK